MYAGGEMGSRYLLITLPKLLESFAIYCLENLALHVVISCPVNGSIDCVSKALSRVGAAIPIASLDVHVVVFVVDILLPRGHELCATRGYHRDGNTTLC